MILYNRMETYNQLIKEFHDSDSQQNNVLQLKAIADELFTAKANKKMYYLMRKSQLANIKKDQENELSRSNVSQYLRMSRCSFETPKQDFTSMDQSELKKKIGQIQKQMAALHAKTQQINNELSIFSKKQQEIEIINKRSGLQVFSAVQVLYIMASKNTEQETKQQEILSQLKHRRQTVAHQIDLLVKEKQKHEEVIKRWNKIKEAKVKSVKVLGASSETFKQILINMLELKKIVDRKEKENQTDLTGTIELVKKRAKKTQMVSLLRNSNIIFGQTFVEKVIKYHSELEDEFDKNERANKQINSYLQTLHIKNDELASIIEKANLHTELQTRQTLKQTASTLKANKELLKNKCSFVTNFTTKCYYLLKKMQSLKKTLNQIAARSKTDKFKSLCKDDTEDWLINSYEEYLNKNPEDNLVRWLEATGPLSRFYQHYIQNNDLLRLFSCPQSHQALADDLSNYEMFLISGLRNANDFIRKMCHQILNFFSFCKSSRSIIICKEKLNDNSLCIESPEYYRRDNYKLLQNMKKLELRKKGLLAQIPFGVSLQNQLLTKKQEKQERNVTSYLSPRKTQINRKLMKYTELATKREENTLKTSAVRKLFGKLNTLQTQSSSRIMTLNSLSSSRAASNSQNYRRKASLKRITMARKTVGTAFNEERSYL